MLLCFILIFSTSAYSTELSFTENHNGRLQGFTGDLSKMSLVYIWNGRCSDQEVPFSVVDGRTIRIDANEEGVFWNGFAGKEMKFCIRLDGYEEKRDLTVRRDRNQMYTLRRR